MKRLLYFLLFLSLATAAKAQTKTTSTVGTKLDVYYTHVTNRCPGCKAIEKETIETLNTRFGKQLKSGEIVLHIVNVDLKENQSIAEQFEAYGSSLFLVKAGDKKASVDLTRQGFAKARTKPAEFRTELADNIQRLLKQ